MRERVGESGSRSARARIHARGRHIFRIGAAGGTARRARVAAGSGTHAALQMKSSGFHDHALSDSMSREGAR